MRKYLFHRDTLLATIFVFLVMGLLSLIPLNTHILDPIKLALKDFDYNDLAYSRMGKNKDVPIDTNIAIVDLGQGQRSEIGAIIGRVLQDNPKVVGVDVHFNEAREPGSDSVLARFFSGEPRVVHAYKLEGEKNLRPGGFFYKTAASSGYTNFVAEEGSVIRYFSPRVKNDTGWYEAFSTSVIKQANRDRYNELIEREKNAEMISYVPKEKFHVVDGMALLQDQIEFSFRNKIVLIGLAHESATSVEDKHFTPMNQKPFGKSLPDQEGVFIHANIVKMVNDGTYISKMPLWLTWLVAVVLCWLHVAFFLSYFVDRHVWFHLAAKLAQIVSFVLFVYLGLLVFNKFNFKINLTPALLAIILAVDVIYFYEAIAKWLHIRTSFKTIFTKSHH